MEHGRNAPATLRRGRWQADPWLLLILAVSAALGLYQIHWGLPVGTNDWRHSWTVDAIEPLTALGIVNKSFGGWNSGWFYFKYPIGYPLLLTVALIPYLGFLFLTGGVRRVTSAYPYGFKDPDQALLIMALIQRVLNVAFVVATVALVFGIARRLFGKRVGYLAAWLTATCYPVVYYAHTSNVDASYNFWLVLALYAAVVAKDTDRWVPWATLGVAAAMAMSTKEQAFGFLLPLPFVVLAARARAHGTLRACWSPAARVMAIAAVVTVVLANNILLNPLGFVSRIAFLLGQPLQPVKAVLKPVEFAWFKGWKEWDYVRQMADALDSALGTPVAVLIAVGFVVVVVRAPRRALWVLLPMAGYYYLSLRGQALIIMRYTLPFLVLSTIFAAALLVELATVRHAAVRAGARVLIAAVVLLGLARAVELNLLLRNDSRRQAEVWMQAHVPDGARGEFYQKPTYLPRFPRRLNASFVQAPERSIAAFQERAPDFVVLSSASKKTITHVWNPDWRQTQTFLLKVPEAAEFATALENGALGYRAAATFQQRPRLLRLATTGLCPVITIYQRDAAAQPQHVEPPPPADAFGSRP